jgi:hypothetical protein
MKFFLCLMFLVSCFFQEYAYGGICGHETTGRISAIYWKANADGLEYALFDRAFETGTGFVYATDFQLKEASLHPTWGFKLGLSQQLGNSPWTIDAGWTRFNTEGSDTVKRTESGVGGFLGNDADDLWLLRGTNAPEAIQGRNKLGYNTIDFIVNYGCFSQQWLCADLFFGAQGAIILEKLQVNYFGTGSYNGDNPIINVHNDFRGIGPVIGVVPCLPLGCGFYLDAVGSVGALWGEFDLTQNEQATSEITITATRNIKRIQSHLNLGINIHKDFCIGLFYVDCVLGYEINYWTNFIRQNRYVNFGPNNSVGSASSFRKNIEQRHGDLVLHGLTTSLRVRF